MTGYVSRCFEFEDFSIFIEIKSLNSKYLEIKFNIPIHLEHMANRLRDILRKSVKRGRVDVYITLIAKEELEYRLLKALVEKYYAIFRKIEGDIGYSLNVSFSDLLSLRSVFSSPGEAFSIPVPEEALEKNFQETVEDFQKFRLKEGELARSDIMLYIDMIEKSLKCIESDYPSVVVKYKEQLKSRIRELIDAEIDETRLLMEAGLFATKADVSEEISRMRGHLASMRSLIDSGRSCGRELDFITQELHREINTLGSKVPEYSVSEQVVFIKSSIEKIKEQVRNIE
jgi:uncharacterized protein (TIGR00255 family)